MAMALRYVALTDSAGVKVLMHTGAAAATTFAAPVSVFTQTKNFNVVGGNLVAIGDVDGDGRLDIVVSNGVSFPMQGGVATTHPGVLLQSASTPGTFRILQDLP
jgi:hypothetical protein